MAEKPIVRWVPAAHIPGATPGRPGGIVAVVIDDLRQEMFFTAAQYHDENHLAVHALDLWDEVRFMQPGDLHPDDFRVLYPFSKDRSDDEIRASLKRKQERGLPR